MGKMLPFPFIQYKTVTFKKKIRKLLHCVKNELSN